MTDLREMELIDGRYRLIQELGAGAFGSVHRATQVVLGKNLREVALKLFRVEAINEDNIAREMNDALAIIELLSQCSDWEIRQHFLTIFDLGLTKESPRRGYIAMELVSDGSLSGRLRAPFTLEGTLPYLTQMVRALTFMHQHRFVHADLKPDNILVFRHAGRDHIKIGDFGLAGKHTGLFGDGLRGGDMAYIAPEILDGMNATPAADVFSMGVMFWEMITGRNPYAGAGNTLIKEQRQDESLMRQLRRDYRRQPLHLKRADYPELNGSPNAAQLGAMLDIINRMLEPELPNRYRSALEIQRDLEVAAGVGRSGFAISGSGSRTVLAGTSDSKAAADRSGERIRMGHEQWESFARLRNWSRAEQTARELMEDLPQQADGYCLLSNTSLKMAAGYDDDPSPRAEKRRRTYRRQAREPLLEGIRSCSDRNELRQLRLALAKIYALLGDEMMSDRLRREASNPTGTE